MAKPASGSTSVYLPVGAYRVGSHLVEVAAASTTTMDLRPSVGAATAGVYGEGADGRSVSPRRPLPVLDVSHRAVVGGWGSGYAQQGGAAGSSRLLAGWEPWFEEWVGLRVAVGVGLLRLERIQNDAASLTGLLLELQIAGGLLAPLPGGAALGPWLAWQVGWGLPVEAALPADYKGPLEYAVHGPDLSLRVVFPRIGIVQGSIEVGAMLREFTPQPPLRISDRDPHLAVGGIGSLSLLIGGRP